MDRNIHLHTTLATWSLEPQETKILHAESDVPRLYVVPGTNICCGTDKEKKTYAEAWKHGLAIAGPQYDLPVLSSVHVVRIIKHVVRS